MMKSNYLSKVKIEQEATFFLEKHSPEALVKPIVLNLESIIENNLQLILDYKQLDQNGTVLGMTIFKTGLLTIINESSNFEKILVKKGTILLNSLLADDIKQQNRYQFTLAHEVGHWFLQAKDFLYDEDQMNIFDQIKTLSEKDMITCLNRSISFDYSTLITDSDWLEWQANYFASAILMPKNIFLKELDELNYNSEYEKLVILSQKFGVSKQAIKNRINNLVQTNTSNQIEINF